MQVVRWLSFCISNAITRPMLHFFPSSGGVTAPYAANCRVSLFGEGMQRQGAVIEGARLSHPDGIRLDEAFPMLKESAQVTAGVELEVSVAQQRIDLSASTCVVELVCGGQSVRFLPKMLPSTASTARRPDKPVGIFRDGYQYPSFVVVNGTKEAVANPIYRTIVAEDGAEQRTLIGQELINAGSAVEISIPDELWAQSISRTTDSGTMNSLTTLVVGDGFDIACYVMYRDASTKRPLSVMAL